MSAAGADEVKWESGEDPFSSTDSAKKKIAERKTVAPASVGATQRRSVGATQRRCRWLAEHPRFQSFILACIGANCVLLALNEPTAEREPLWMIHTDSALSFIFLGEFALKLVALRGEYWRGGALNWLDAVVALEGGLSAVTYYAASGGGGPFDISVLRMARLVRPLRTLNRFPSVRIVVDALMQSMVGLASILGILAGALLMFALLCVTLWAGLLDARCLDSADAHDYEILGDDALYVPADGAELVCRSVGGHDGDGGGGGGACGAFDWMDTLAACPNVAVALGSRAEAPGACVDVGAAPGGGFESFDHLGAGFLTLFVVTTLDGWAEPLWRVQRVTNAWLPLAIFTVVILVGSYLIVNLLIAEMLTRFQASHAELESSTKADARDAKRARARARWRRLRAIRSLLIGRDLRSLATAATTTPNDAPSAAPPEPLAAAVPPRQPRSLRARAKWELELLGRRVWSRASKLWICAGFAPTSTPNGLALRAWVADDDSSLGRGVHATILLNLIALALDGHDVQPWLSAGLHVANLLFTAIFAAELAVKLIVLGPVEHFSSAPGMNSFDALIVLSSLVELLLGGSSSGGAMRMVRMCRLLRAARAGRVARRYPALCKVAGIAVRSAAGLAPIALLLALFLFVSTLLGMQLFGQTFTSDTYGAARARGEYPRVEDAMRFDAFGFAMIECFMILAGEGWSERMYAAMRGADHGAPAFYYIAILVFGQYALLNLTLAIVLDGSSALLTADHKNQDFRGMVLRLYVKRTSYLYFHRWRLAAHAIASAEADAAASAASAAADSSGGAQGEWAAFCGLHFPSHSEHGGDHLAAHAPRVVTAETHAYARETDEYEQAALHKLQADAAVFQRNLGMVAKPRAASERRKKTARLDHIRSLSHHITEDEERVKGEVALLGNLFHLNDDDEGSGNGSSDAPGADEPARAHSSLGARCSSLLHSAPVVALMKVAVIASTCLMLDPDALAVASRRTTSRSRLYLAADQACTALFVLEALAKMVAFGVACPPWPYSREALAADAIHETIARHADKAREDVEKAHKARGGFLGTFWDLNDALLVTVSLASYGIAGTAPDTARTARTLRLLGVARGGRPLRLLNHMPAIADMLASLMTSIKTLSTAASVMFFCWFAFAVVGMELFKGLLWHCTPFARDARARLSPRFSESDETFPRPRLALNRYGPGLPGVRAARAVRSRRERHRERVRVGERAAAALRLDRQRVHEHVRHLIRRLGAVVARHAGRDRDR